MVATTLGIGDLAIIADGDTVFNGTELTGTGLVNGTSAIAIAVDNAEFGTRTHNIQAPDLFAQINNNTDWVQNDNSPQDGTATGTPAFTAPDAQIWVAASGAGEAIVTINLDATYGSGTLGYQIVQAFQNDANLFHPSDITLDTVHGKFFFVDSDVTGGHNRIVEGSISQLLNNPGQPLTFNILYADDVAEANPTHGMRTLSIDSTNGIIYFDHATTFNKITYSLTGVSTSNQPATQLANLGNSNYVTQVSIDYAHGQVLLGSSRVVSFFGDVVEKNYVYTATGLTSGSSTLTFTHLPFDPDDADLGPEGTPLPNDAWPVERGTIRGIDIDPVSQIAYIVTGTVILDNDSNGATTYFGGIYSYALTGNASGTVTTLFTQDGTNGPKGLMYYIDVDHTTGKFYVIDETGTNADPGDGAVYSGSLTVAGTPTFLATVGNFNGLGPQGLEIQHAPTLTGTGLNATFTETAGNPSSNGTPVQVADTFQTTDADSGGAANGDELAGAQVRITANLQTGAGHQDQLTINGNTSGSLPFGGDTVNFSYNNATGVMTLTGITTLDNYESALALVSLRVDGDNPTNYGAATTRTLSYSTFDGALYSDEINASVTVVGINDAPVNVVPGTQTFNEDTNRVFSTAGGNALSLSDVDADPASQALQVTLSVLHGTLTLASLAGLAFSAGDGTADTTMTFTGTANAINAALAAGLTFNPTADYNGSDTLTFTVNDQGFNGSPGATQDSDTVTLTINAVADIVNDSKTTNEDTATSITVLANDTFEGTPAITAIGAAAHGTAVINDNGTAGNTTDDFIVYTPTADYNGADSFTYTVTSPAGVTEQATVNVTVNAVADIVNDTATTNEDTAVNVFVQGNDTFENPAHAITAVGAASHGTAVINNNGTGGDTTDDYIVYTPTADYNGADSFTYTVTSPVGVTEQATVNVTVNAVADVANDTSTTNEDVAVNVLVQNNDTFENPAHAITAVGAPAHGTAVINNNGTGGDATDDYIVYTPTADYNGADSFTYTVTSPAGVTEIATVNVTVNAVADIADDSVTVAEDSGANNLTLLANDTFENAVRAITAVSAASNGSTSINNNGTPGNTADDFVVYTPTGNYNGSDSFTYTVTSPAGVTETATVNVTVNAVNDAPTATITPPTYNATENVALSLKSNGLLVGDIDGLSGSETVTLSVSEGILNVTAGGSGAGVSNSGSATVTITGTIAQINALLNTDATSTVSYVENDDTPSAAVTLTLAINDNGNTGTGVTPTAQDTATINITAVNDLPVVGNLTPSIAYLVASPPQTLSSGATVTDPDSASLTSASVTLTDHQIGDELSVNGALAGGPVSGISWVYTAATGVLAFTGLSSLANYQALLDQVQYRSSSADPSNGGANTSRDVAWVLNDGTDPSVTQHTSISVEQAPTVDLNGADAGTGATLSYTENDAATAVASAGTVTDGDSADFNGGSLTVHFSANGAAEDQLSILTDGTVTVSSGAVSVGGLAVGTVSGGANGTDLVVSFNTANATPAAISTLVEHIAYADNSESPSTAARTLTFSVDDGDGATGSATATVNVTSINAAPVATITPTSYNTTEQTALSLKNNGLAVSDVDGGTGGETVTLSVGEGVLNVTTGGSGALVANSGTNSVTITGTLAQINALLHTDATSTVSYIDNSDTPGASTTLSLLIHDNGNTGTGGDLSANDTATINITAVNDAPQLTGFGDSSSFTENTASVVLDTVQNASVGDAELNVSPSNYAGTTLTIARSGGANSDDSFVGTGSLDLTDVNGLGENVSLGGTFIGTYTDPGDGSVSFTFNADAHAADINSVMRQIVYFNGSDNPPASVQVDFAFSDGNGQPGGQPQGSGPTPGTATASFTVNITQVDDAPVLFNVALGAAYSPGSSGSVLSPALSVFDVDATPPSPLTGLASATVKIATGFFAGDELFVNLPTDGSGHFITPDTGTSNIVVQSNVAGQLVLSGNDSVLAYQEVLAAVSYHSTAANPSNGGANPTRNITWQVNDGVLNSQTPNTDPNNPVSDTLLHFNAAPSVDLDGSTAGNNYVTSFTENGAPLAIVNANVSVIDPDDAAISAANIVLTNAKTADALSIAGALPGGINNSIDTSVAGHITLHLNGSASLADYQTALGQIFFVNTSDNPDLSSRDITVQVANADASNVAHTTIAMVGVNDPPVVHGSVTLTAIAADSGAHAITQADLLGNASDADGPSLIANNLAIASGLGSLVDNHDGTWTYTPALHDDSAVSLSYQVADGVSAPVADSATLDITPFSGTAHWMASVDFGSHPAGWLPATVGDFNGDGTSDILWFNSATTDVDLWKISNGQWAGSIDVGTHPAGYAIAGSGDFNKDGTSDVLWYNSTTAIVDVWKISNGQWAGSVPPMLHPAGYTISSTGDFNGDGIGDVLWHNAAKGDVDLWKMFNGQWAGSINVGDHPAGYSVAGSGDFNKDGTSDLLWYNPTTRDVDLWLIANGQWTGSVDLGTHPAGYTIAGVGDFNHDGTSDIAWFNPTTSDVDIWQIVNGHWSASADLGSHPAGWTIAGVGDFNHDNTSDILWQQTGTTHVEGWLLSNH